MSSVPLVRKLCSASPSRLSSLRIRDVIDQTHIFPEKLEHAIKSHYKDLSYTKQEQLSKALSRQTASTIYPTAPVPKYHNLKSEEDLYEAAALSYKKYLSSQDKNILKNVDFLMYRSFPSLFYIANRMFSELAALDKDFSPLSMLDLGNNLAASVWASQKFYGESIDDYIVHEHNKAEYNRTIKLLNIKYKPYVENVTVKGAFSMPKAQDNPFDIVTAINYFPYFDSSESKKWFDRVWNCVGDYLIIADISNRYTAKRMSEIRSYFLKKHGKKGHIVAPCPHANACPALKRNDSQVCRFAMNYVRPIGPKKLLPHGKKMLDHQKTEFTYLILKRGKKKDVTQHARMLRPPTLHHKKTPHKKKEVEFLTCNPDGAMWRAKVFRNDSPMLYKHVVGLKAGDLVDQNWLNHKFTPGVIDWNARSIKQQVGERVERNRQRYSYELDLEQPPEASEPDVFEQMNRHGDGFDGEVVFSDDHIESLSLLDGEKHVK